MSKRKYPELKVVFDTNVLYSGTASNLLNAKVSAFIKNFDTVADIIISWYLPQVVVQEREYQMLEKGKDLLPSIQKLEQLLGHNLNITEEIICDRIRVTIEKQLAEYSLKIIDLDLGAVDWGNIVNKSTHRIPPFQKGDSEKGFRDALISESFMQLVKSSPKTPQFCRLVFVTNDELLSTDLSRKVQAVSNVKIYKDIEDVKSLIHTLTSQVKEELIEKIKDKISNYFFDKSNNDCLYFKDKIIHKIEERYADKLAELPPNSDSRANGTKYISAPRFFSKKGQRITWKTRIDIVSKAYKKTRPSQKVGLGLAELYAMPPKPESSEGVMGLAGLFQEKDELIADGRTTFEITWSVVVTTNYKLRNPKIESIDFIEINWEDKLA